MNRTSVGRPYANRVAVDPAPKSIAGEGPTKQVFEAVSQVVLILLKYLMTLLLDQSSYGVSLKPRVTLSLNYHDHFP